MTKKLEFSIAIMRHYIIINGLYITAADAANALMPHITEFLIHTGRPCYHEFAGRYGLHKGI